MNDHERVAANTVAENGWIFAAFVPEQKHRMQRIDPPESEH